MMILSKKCPLFPTVYALFGLPLLLPPVAMSVDAVAVVVIVSGLEQIKAFHFPPWVVSTVVVVAFLRCLRTHPKKMLRGPK